MAQQRPGAPQGKHYRAKQIPQQLRRPGERHGCDIFQQFSALAVMLTVFQTTIRQPYALQVQVNDKTISSSQLSTLVMRTSSMASCLVTISSSPA